MAFPSAQIIETANLDSGTDNPALAREDLLDAVTALNEIIASENTALGVVTLDSGGKIRANTLPTNYTVTGDINLTPSTGIVKIANCLRLPSQQVADLTTDFPTPQLGDVVAVSDGDSGDACLAMWNGSAWKVIALGATVSAS